MEAQRIINLADVQRGEITVGAVLRRPHDLAAVICEFLRRAEVIKLIVERRSFAWTFAVEHCQRAEAARFVNVAAVAVFRAFSDQSFALPQKLGSVAVDGFFDTATKGVVFVGCGTAARQADADEAVLAVVAVFGDEFLAGTTAFADQVAVGIVVVMAVALHQQAVAFDVGQVRCAFVVLTQQVTGRIMGEAFRCGAAHADESVERVVVVAALAFAAVIDTGEIAVGVVVVSTLKQVLVSLADCVGLQATLLIVLVLAEQQTLLALLFASGAELVSGQARAIEVDAAQTSAGQVTVVKFAAIGQAAVVQLADAVIFVTCGAPALVFSDQAILHIVFVGEWPIAVVDIYQTTQSVVAVVNLFAIGEDFYQQAARSIALVFGNEFAAVIAEFGFLDQLAVEVVLVGSATTVETGLLLDQAVRVIVELIAFTALVLDLGEVELRVVVAIAQLAAVRIDAAADKVQVVGVFVASDAAEFVTFGGDVAIGVVGEGTCCAVLGGWPHSVGIG